MDAPELRIAFRAMDEVLGREAYIVIAGAAALVLIGELKRSTADCDVIHADPPLADMKNAIAAVAESHALSAEWLNTNVSIFADILPADYRARWIHIGTFGQLTVHALGRNDLVLMKLMALRSQDMDDLDEIKPTQDELRFAISHFPRLAPRYHKKVIRARHYIEGSGVRPTEQGFEAGRSRRLGKGADDGN